jgi:hypothetical protein
MRVMEEHVGETTIEGDEGCKEECDVVRVG